MDDDEGSSIYLYSEAGTENQDAKVAEREAEEETDKSYYMNKDGKQILKYPKIKISIRLSV
jgi:hypothetical protein